MLELLEASVVVLNLGCTLESPGKIEKKKNLDAQAAFRPNYITILGREGNNPALVSLKFLSRFSCASKTEE